MHQKHPDPPVLVLDLPSGTLTITAEGEGSECTAVVPDLTVRGVPGTMTVIIYLVLRPIPLTLEAVDRAELICNDDGVTVWDARAWRAVDNLIATITGPDTAAYRLDLLRWLTHNLSDHLAQVQQDPHRSNYELLPARAGWAWTARILATHTAPEPIRAVALSLCVDTAELVAEMTPEQLIETAELLAR